MPLLRRLILSALLLCLSWSAGAGQSRRQKALQCSESFGFLARLGTLLEPEDASHLEFYDPRNTYHRLGEGPGGGTVLRVESKVGARPPFQLKEYRDPGQRERDLRAFAYLDQFSGPEVHVVRPKRYGNRSIWFRDIRGQTLEKVLMKKLVPEAEKEKLIADWNHFVNRVHENLSRKTGVVSLLKFQERAFTPALKLNAQIQDAAMSFDVFLKTNNVIVESKTGRLILIDPY